MINILEFSQVIDLLDEFASPSVVNRALEAVDLSRSTLRGADGFIPYRLEASVVEHVARTLGDVHLGARLAPRFDYGAYSAYARYVLGAKDLGSGLIRGSRAFSLIQPGGEIVIKEKNGHVVVGRRSALGSAIGHLHLDDGAIFILVDVIRHFLGPDWRPIRIGMTGNTPSRVDFLETAIGAPVYSGADMPSVVLRKADLLAPNPYRPDAQDIVTLRDLPVLMRVVPPENMTKLVEQVIQTQIALGDASEELVANRLSMGKRTLQRALRKEGTTFRDVKLRMIEKRARALLAETDLPLSEIAASLGYEEPKSFQRAFQRQTGLTPHAYRASLSSEPTPTKVIESDSDT